MAVYNNCFCLKERNHLHAVQEQIQRCLETNSYARNLNFYTSPEFQYQRRLALANVLILRLSLAHDN